MSEVLNFFDTNPYLVLFISFAIGYLFMPVVIEVAKKHNFVVSPNKRTSHDGDIPNIGGINIFVSFLLTVFFFSFSMFSEMQFAIMGLAIILIVGFIDDLIELQVSWKLFGQFLSGFFLIVMGDMRFTTIDVIFGTCELSLWVSYLVTFFIFILIVNALNLIDGIDGLASGLGIIYSLFFGFYFYATGSKDLSISAFAMVGSLAVFFFYNVFGKHRKIFMGDSGSLLLGYMMFLYVYSFCEYNANGTIPEKYKLSHAPVMAFTILLVPLFDVIRVAITRIKKRKSPFSADKNHIHHLLMGLGLGHKTVTSILMGLTVIFMFFALIARNLPSFVLLSIDLIFAISSTLFIWNKINKKKIEQHTENKAL